MIACPSCGYPNDDFEHRCEQCGRRFDALPPVPSPPDETWLDEEPDRGGDSARPPALSGPPPAPAVPSAAAPVISGSPALAAAPHPWRNEISSRVERFRRRRRAQASLPLDFGHLAETVAPPSASPRPVAVPAMGKVIRFEEIPGAHVFGGRRETKKEEQAQPPPTAPPSEPSQATARAIERQPDPRPAPRPPRRSATKAAGSLFSQASLAFPEPRAPWPAEAVESAVAPLAARMMAGAADSLVVGCGSALFFIAYSLMGGRFVAQKSAIAAFIAAIGVIVFTYSVLSLYFSTATPGMRWMGLRLVDFEGHPARRGQRALRLLGLAASGAALGVGFLWAFVDEDALTWHDRISRTCLTLQ